MEINLELKIYQKLEIIFDYKTFSHWDNQLSLNGMIQNGQMKTIYTESDLDEYYSYYSYVLSLINVGSVILKNGYEYFVLFNFGNMRLIFILIKKSGKN